MSSERSSERSALIDIEKEGEDSYGTFDVNAGAAGQAIPSRMPHSRKALGEEWMSRLDDDILISALSIPGTHDSAAFTYSWPFVATQKLDILQQLDAGIRYFDLRCGVRDDIVEMCHGITYLGLRLEAVLDTMYVWLEAHPTEALIVQIKRDRDEQRSTVHFSQAVTEIVQTRPERWRTANTTPSLAELRGKIQLFRRFHGPSLLAYGIDVTRWQDNPSRPFTIWTWHGVRITIQDHYSFTDPEPLPSLITKKGGDVSELLDRAAADTDPEHWYVNFTSGFEFNLYYQLSPREVALGGWWAFRWEDGMNLRLSNYLKAHQGKKRYGIVTMDFPEAGAENLITNVIRSNFQSEAVSWEQALFFMPLLIFCILVAAALWIRAHQIDYR